MRGGAPPRARLALQALAAACALAVVLAAGAAAAPVARDREPSIVRSLFVRIFGRTKLSVGSADKAGAAAGSSVAEDTQGEFAVEREKPATKKWQPLSSFLLHMEDCSGSTWADSVARALLAAHGVPFEDRFSERLKQMRWNIVGGNGQLAEWQEEKLRGMMQKAVDRARMKGNHFIGKFTRLDQSLGTKAFASAFLTPWELANHTRVVNVWRSPLDKLLCEVHDCFHETDTAHMVVADGSWWRCDDFPWKPNETGAARWSRRRVQARKNGTKIFLDPSATELAMRKGVALGDEQAHFLSSLGFANTSFATLTVEDLEAFEYDAERLEDSVSAWMQWMGSWGVDARRDTVRRVISNGARASPSGPKVGGNVGSRPRKPLSHYVYNADEVQAALLASGDARVRALVREHDGSR